MPFVQEWIEPDTAPSAALARCKVCKDLMALILQLNAELPDKFPHHDRRIYVFACRRNSCRRRDGSIRTLRGVRIWKDDDEAGEGDAMQVEKEQEQEKKQPEEPKPRLGDALFGGGNAFGTGSGPANPFSTGASSAAPANPFSSGSANPFSAQPAEKPVASDVSEDKLRKTFAETLSLNAPKPAPPPAPEAWPAEDAQPTPYPTLYLDQADYETLDPTPTTMPANARIEDADAPEPSILDREAFESTMDATFQKFADRLSQNPEQVIRYEFGGVPLVCSKTDAVGVAISKAAIPRCPACGGRRTFEVQLTPNAIAELEEDDLSLEGMEWGTIIVGVCEADCVPHYTAQGDAAYLEEWAGVQWEELSKKK